MIFVTDVENQHQVLGGSNSYSTPGSVTRAFGKRRNSREMASDALWIVSFKCVVKASILTEYNRTQSIGFGCQTNVPHSNGLSSTEFDLFA